MKNGCCRDCMKAFSKNGKVSIDSRLTLVFRVVCARCQDCKDDPLCPRKGVNTAVVMDVIPLTLGKTSDNN